ncbi:MULTISPECIES: FG-GAP and VCBS repeat-containing protein [unclassified Novosphingobium]|uniref:FG-GAP repeat domain-containing protein n=1 Tax=unclassified Novosphingobium TaxID=2644732 RepID=UPI0025E4B8AF|nr:MULTISPECIES: FG-GAP and VCBS repeat-containing protein [unclassified Novosphingobium]HQV02830.1 FG-GAP repeat protein [Novosphingobium sp.]
MKLTNSIIVLVGTLFSAAPALAASDYLLEIEGIKGETKAAPMPVDDWSFRACNAGQCTKIVAPRDSASGLATGKTDGKGKPSSTSWDLATNKGARTAGGVNVAVGDVDGDGRADLAFAGAQNEVSNLSFTFQKITVEWRGVCNGKHFDKATLRSSSTGDLFEITDATVTCLSGPRQTSGRAAVCSAADCDLAGPVTMTITGGQMKHTKTGHVTLLK